MLQRINLLQALPKPPVHYLQPNMIVMVLGSCFMVAICIVIYTVGCNYTLSSQYNNLIYKRALLDNALIEMAEVGKANKQLNGVRDDISALQLQITEKTQLMSFPEVKQLQNTSGFSAYLMSLAKRVMPGLWLKKIIIRNNGDSITLIGQTTQARSVMTFLQGLRKEKSYRGKVFLRYELQHRDDNSGVIDFKLKTKQ